MSKPNLRVRTTLMWTAIPLLAWTVAASAQPAATPERAASFKGTLITLNNSGVTGTFTVEQMGQGQIRVSIHATGLEPTTNPHVAHIHGVQGKTNASCPTMAQDTDGDGYVELAEGLTT